MSNDKREKLHHDIFMMYDAASETIGSHTHNATVKIEELKKALTSGDVHQASDFDSEIEYLIAKGYFKRYAVKFIIATPDGIDKILGETSYSKSNLSEKQIKWFERWWVQWLFFPVIAGLIIAYLIYCFGWNR